MGAMWHWINLHWNDEWAKFVEGILLLLLGFVIASVVRRTIRSQLKRPHIDQQVALLISRIAYLTVVLLGVVAFFTRWFGSAALGSGGVGLTALAVSTVFQVTLI